MSTYRMLVCLSSRPNGVSSSFLMFSFKDIVTFLCGSAPQDSGGQAAVD